MGFEEEKTTKNVVFRQSGGGEIRFANEFCYRLKSMDSKTSLPPPGII